MSIVSANPGDELSGKREKYEETMKTTSGGTLEIKIFYTLLIKCIK